MTELRCAEVEARFIDAFDGRLDPADSVRFHSHIEGCAACRDRAAIWRGLVPALREAVPPGPDAMATRRMQVEIERQLGGRVAASPARRWRPWWAPAFGLVAAAAAIVFWMRVGGREPAKVASYAVVNDIGGDVRVGETSLSLSKAARIPANTPIMLAADGAINMELDGGAAVEVAGPARLTLEGSARAVAVRLSEGRLSAQVTHRKSDETFAVITRHARVEVRGTQFSVAASGETTHVEVLEGQVAVLLDDGRSTLVPAGGSYDWHPPGVGPPPVRPEFPPPAAPADTSASLDRSIGCGDVARACQATARAVRAAMRGGDTERALRLIADARRGARSGDASCPGGAGACDDELRYLHAEALNQAGRLDEAVSAYRALDRRGAPSAMRQNALYAAAQIERRQGHLAAAAADFELASAAAPRGALRAEALVGAMESARAAGDVPRARALAGRYLDEFPHGLGAAAARKLTSGP